jgi:hypothetical protein
MDTIDWAKSFSASVTVCDTDAIILYMNDKSADSFQERGGRALIGKSLYDCHNPESCETIRRILQDEKANIYSIEQKGVHKMIYQAPWYRDGGLAGILEIVFEIPNPLPHFVRGE